MEHQESSCSPSSSLMKQCRICHDEEDQSCSTMESPCACSGSLKYAHRGCVQRWCDEKGSTLCEICLQNFEAGYTVAPKKPQPPADVAVTMIRGSLEEEEEALNLLVGPDAAVGDPPAECAEAAVRSAFWCRSVAVTFTVVLLLRHLAAVVTVGAANQYAFGILTVYMLRASGILLPFYLVMRLISAIQQEQRQNRLQLLLLQEQRRNAARMLRLQEQQQQQHVILVR